MTSLSDIKTPDLEALSQFINYWTTSPGFDSRWVASDGRKGLDKDGLDIAGRAAAKRADQFGQPTVEAIDAVVRAREVLAAAEAALLTLAQNGTVAKAIKCGMSDDSILSVHNKDATPDMDADDVLAALKVAAQPTKSAERKAFEEHMALQARLLVPEKVAEMLWVRNNGPVPSVQGA